MNNLLVKPKNKIQLALVITILTEMNIKFSIKKSKKKINKK